MRASMPELLEFCNEVRDVVKKETNDQEILVLDRLMPAIPGNQALCLVAKNVNCGFEVHCRAVCGWAMYLPQDEETLIKIADQLYLGMEDTEFGIALILPEEIGQVAEDFDELERLCKQHILDDFEAEQFDELKELLPYIDASIRDTYERGTVLDGKLVS